MFALSKNFIYWIYLRDYKKIKIQDSGSTMKRTGSVVAAVASSATVVAGAISYSDPMPDYTSQQHQKGKKDDDVDEQDRRREDPTDRFAPRFDGLRFIETLVTAHR